MYLSLNWLKDFVSIPRSVSVQEVADKLTLHTVEVEDIVKQAEKFDSVIVGKILEIKKHSNADKLQVAKVNVGSEKLDIVCGAPNIEVGQLVPVALVGAILPNGLEIKKAEVRGEMSEGMMCAPDEIGFGDDHSGILILDKKAKIGKSIAEYFKFGDTVLEVDNKSLSNRPDLLNHYGIARELSAIFNTKLKQIDSDKLKKLISKNKNKELNILKVKVKDEKLCPRYMAIEMKDIEIGESPKWIQERLIAVGMRPISNIVDIINYVMFEFGQPMHAFDADKVSEIGVRPANAGEEIETLDGQIRKLEKNMLLIIDSKKPIAIAGVMGSANSEVGEEIKNIILESANFEPYQTRKTTQILSLRTEASTRFEKSLDPNLCETALARAIELILESCPKASISSNLIDEKNFKLDQGPIDLDLKWMEKIVGQVIEVKKIKETLILLGFEIAEENKEDGILKIMVPSWRATRDVSISEDVVEEIIRIYGFNNIKIESPLVELQAPKLNNERLIERSVKNILSKSASLNETYNYSFVGEELLKKLNIDFSSHIKLVNPLSKNHTMLRQSLVPNLLENIHINQSKFNQIGIFEIGSVFYDLPSSINKDVKSKESLPFQEKRLAIMIASDNSKKTLNKLKGQLEILLENFDLDLLYEKKDDSIGWEDVSSLTKIIINNQEIGFLSLVDDKALNRVGIKIKVGVLEINFDLLYRVISNKTNKSYQEILKYPSAVRDIAFVVRDKILYNDIKNEIEIFDELIASVELFDVYQGNKLGKDKKSLAFHVSYQADDRTLVNEEVDQIQNSLVKHLEKKYEAQIRNF